MSDVRLLPGDSREVLRTFADGSFDSCVTDPPYARMACAIEDAGFEIRDSILDMVSGDAAIMNFTESLNDEQRVAFFRCIEESGFGGLLAWAFGTGFPKSHDVSKAIDKAAGAEREVNISAPATDLAVLWSGWGTALKPAFEPIVLARKPLIGTVVANVLDHGTGPLNIDGCRIEVGEGRPLRIGDYKDTESVVYTGRVAGDESFRGGSRAAGNTDIGRWPANIVHDGSDEVLAAFPDSAARFFFGAKADKEDRWGSRHPTVKPVELIRWLMRLITPPGGIVLDPFAGSGTAGVAAIAEGFDAVLIEREEEYQRDVEARLAYYRGEGRHWLTERAIREADNPSELSLGLLGDIL